MSNHLAERVRREEEQLRWRQARPGCPVMQEESLTYISECIYQNHKGCPKDCALYDKSSPHYIKARKN